MSGRFSGNLGQRLVSSIFALIGLLLAIVFASYPLLQPLFVAIVAGIVGIALQEYYRMAKRLGTHPVSTAAIFCSTFYIFAVYLSTQGSQWEPFPQVALAFSFITLFVHFFFKGSSPLLNFAVTIFGLIWITIPLSLLVSVIFFFPLDYHADGRLWFLYLLLITNVTDSGGYFIGKPFGKRRLAPDISPNKTVEGAIGGMLAALVTSMAFWCLLSSFSLDSPFDLTFAESVVLGLTLGLMAQLGDLAESLLKRDADVKDSNSLPGLGGVLDMVDSLIFTTPVLYLFLIIR